MTAYVITFVIMVGVFMAGCFALKLPVGVSMMIAALCGAIQGGLGLETLRMMVEGEFGYVDTILTIGCAMIFMKVIEDSGALDALSSLIIERFHKVPAVLLILIMLIIMFPGMITGSSTAAVLSAGSIMAPVLALMGIDAVTAGSIIAMGALLGMIAPPVNTAALIICAGIDVPYVGFEGPLALLTFPLAILFVLLLGYKQARHLDYEKLKPALVEQDAVRKQYGFKIYIPLVVLVVLMVVFKVLKLGEDIGMPLMFMLSAVSGLFTGKKINVLQAVPAAIRTAAPVMGILMGVGMFIEVMTATGVRGLVVISCLRLPQVLWLVACAVSIPLFGAVSSYMIFTMARTGYFAVGITLCFALVIMAAGRGKEKIRNAGRSFLWLALSVAVCLPVTFTLQRNVPAAVSDPFLYEIEYSMYCPQDVMRGRNLDSKNFMRVGRFIDVFAEKIFGIPEGTFDVYGEIEQYQSTHKEKREQTEKEKAILMEEMEAAGQEIPQEVPKQEDYTNGRTDIFRSYIEQLNWTGHEEMGAVLQNGEIATHAHNIYLQAAYDHGIFVGIVFVLVGIAAFVKGCLYYCRKRDKITYAALPVVVTAAVGVAGMVEWVFHLSNPCGLFLMLVITPLLFQEESLGHE